MTLVGYYVVPPSQLEITGGDVYSDQQTIGLQCRVRAFPQLSIVWYLRDSSMGRLLLTSSRVLISHNFAIENGEPFFMSELHISNVSVSDSGDYVCAASATGHSIDQMGVHSLTVTRK